MTKYKTINKNEDVDESNNSNNNNVCQSGPEKEGSCTVDVLSMWCQQCGAIYATQSMENKLWDEIYLVHYLWCKSVWCKLWAAAYVVQSRWCAQNDAIYVEQVMCAS